MRIPLLITLMVVLASSCSVISRHVRTESEPAVPFKTLVREADRYVGKTVILGGYILETKNLADETIIEVLQAPLTFRDEPNSKDLSEGRLIISHKEFLDPEVYSKDRKLTVAGTLSGCWVEKVRTCKLESREIYVWPEYGYGYPYPYPYYYYYPSGRYWHRHHRRHYYYW
jgi:outer membrane lipoprotein